MHRVLLVTENYPPDRGGMSESCDRIVRGLRREEVAVDIVHFDRRAARPELRRAHLRWPLENDPAHTINCAWNRARVAFDLEAVTHVVAFGGYLPLLAAPAFAAWIGRPLVTLLRGNELDAGLFDPRRRPLLDDALRRSAAVCTVTTEQAEKVRALHGIEPHVVANGIDFDLWQATDADRARAASVTPQPRNPAPRLLGLFGHLKAKKAVPFFLEALRSSGVAECFRLLLVGESDALLLDDLDATHLPPVDRFDLLPYYLACDFVVLPSHYDGFPNVLIEAAALAKPLIASRTGGMRDLLTDGENAFLFDPGDEAGCCAAIGRAAEADDAMLARMGACAARVARERCDARGEARRYVEVLDETRRSDVESMVDRAALDRRFGVRRQRRR
jgi:glycosyltransferase involved in cell wall biosynthesis